MMQPCTVVAKVSFTYDDGHLTERQAQDLFLDRVDTHDPRVELQHFEIVAGLVDSDGVPLQQRVPAS